MRNIILSIEHDHDAEMPDSACDGWKLVSFSRRHINSGDPFDYFTENRKVSGKYTSKARAGLFYVLSYYEHGGCEWSMKGEGVQCQWDSVGVAGVLVWTGKPTDLPKDKRNESARSFLKEYNEWANGNCYYYSLTTDEGEDVGGCGGIIGSDYLAEIIGEDLEPGDRVKIEGEMHFLGDYLKFPAGVEKVDDFDDEEEAA
jgi:hypothetical protein